MAEHGHSVIAQEYGCRIENGGYGIGDTMEKRCSNCVHLDMTQRKHEFEDEYYCNMTLARIDEFNEKNKDMDLMDRFRFLPSFWISINQIGCSFFKSNDEKPPEDCTTMNLYGDGKKFLHPVWYSCGRCTPCPRDPEAKE